MPEVRIGPSELVIILIIALLLFGPSRLPELGRAVGKTIQNFKRAAREDDSDEAGGRK